MRRLLFAGLVVASGCSPSAQEYTADVAPPPTQVPTLDRENLDEEVSQSIDRAMQQVRSLPHDAQHWGLLGMLLLAHDLLQPAVTCLEEAGRLRPNDPRWPYYESIALRTLNLSEAIDQLREAIELWGDEPASRVARQRLAEMLVEAEDLSGAEVVVSDILRINPDDGRAHLTLAKVFLLRNQPDRALSSIDKIRTKVAPTKTMLLLAAESHRRQGNFTEANRLSNAARRAGELTLDDPLYSQLVALRTGLKAKLTEADRLYQQYEVDASIKKLEQMAIDYPDSEWTRILLARGYIRKRQLSDAESTLAVALRLNPNSFQANFRMGVVFQVGGQHRKAIEWFEKTVRLQPSSAVAFKNIGLSQFLLGDQARAERAFRQAVEAQPNYFDGHLALGDFYLKTGDVVAARAAFDAAERLQSGDPRVSNALRQLDSMPNDK